jgi:tetratricopeptide (TPR) repeat protein
MICHTRYPSPGAALALGIAVALCLSLPGCSSAPKKAVDTVALKNEAADYAKLADDFFFKGQYLSALQFYGEALELNLSVDNIEGVIVARNALGRTLLVLGRLDDAEREFTDALRDGRPFGKPALIAQSLSNLGELYYTRSRLEEAETFLMEAERLAPTNDAVWAVVAHNRGVVAVARGDLNGARAYLLKAEQANERAKRWSVLGTNRYVLASVAYAQGSLDEALRWAEQALAADKTAENSLGIGADLEALGRLSRRAGQAEKAFEYFRRSFGLWLALGKDLDAERVVRELRELALELGEEDYAIRYGRMLEGVE